MFFVVLVETVDPDEGVLMFLRVSHGEILLPVQLLLHLGYNSEMRAY